jgi:hypothetical protein
MPLRQLDRDLACIDHDFRMGGLRLGARTSVARGPDGSVALHSPGPLTEEDAAQIRAFGPVRSLLAPNLLHHLFLADARRLFPEAQLVAPAGLARKRPDLHIDVPLSGGAGELPAWFAGVLAPIAVGGMPKVDEIAWVHAPTRTLLLGDLAFNLRPPKPWFTRTFMRLNRGWDRFGPTRMLRATIRDRAAVRAGIDAVLAHDFDRVVVTHGDVLDRGGHDALREGYAWL